ncbi:MAG: DegT/DnrJ/EryC1/StrS family aminotransferase [Bacteroidales bacterium]|nr:DegT/DnrJ/EryC1/StrS family aminotransferase [Bacteroidales bacterium]
MREIQMVDLKRQYEKIKGEVDSAIQEVIDSTTFIKGPAVKKLEADLAQYLDVNNVVACGNGTDALQVSMMALDLKPGDEVITTSFTFIATAEVIALLGLTPVLVDVKEDTFNVDPQAIRNAITPKTKAIVPVHLFGQCADMEAIMEIAKEHNLYVIEDACQAIGTEYIYKDGSRKMAGTIGDTGATSFFPSKNLGCYGDGGAIYTNNNELAQQLRVVVNHGMARRYYHDYVGVNSRLDSMQAAVLNVKLKYLDQYNANRRKAADYYDKAFENHPSLITPKRAEHSTHVFHQYTLITKNIDRDGLQEHLKGKGIANAVYYPVPLHMQKAYIDPRYKEGDFPVCEKLSKTVISLPMHTELDEEQLEFITSAVLEYCNK